MQQHSADMTFCSNSKHFLNPIWQISIRLECNEYTNHNENNFWLFLKNTAVGNDLNSYISILKRKKKFRKGTVW